jgi:predicted alpha/beta-hydrolase family hydrolase
VAVRPPVLDAAWVPTLATLLGRGGRLARVPGPLVVAGRSAGARVACRTAADVGADAVLCLSFPLHPPGRPQATRAAELAMPLTRDIRVHVVQGERDPFGTPSEILGAATELADRVHAVPGTHTIPASAAGAVARAVADALADIRLATGE